MLKETSSTWDRESVQNQSDRAAAWVLRPNTDGTVRQYRMATVTRVNHGMAWHRREDARGGFQLQSQPASQPVG